MSAGTDVVERVAPIVARALAKRSGLADHRPCDAWLSEATVATHAALEASHHAELVEALRDMLTASQPQHTLRRVFLSEAQEAARVVLAKVRGEQVTA